MDNDQTAASPLIPVRIVNEFVYCPRLAFMEWVHGEFAHNADTVEGAIRHKRVDQGGGALPADAEEQEVIHARSVQLSSERVQNHEGLRRVDAVVGVSVSIDPGEGVENDRQAGNDR